MVQYQESDARYPYFIWNLHHTLAYVVYFVTGCCFLILNFYWIHLSFDKDQRSRIHFTTNLALLNSTAWKSGCLCLDFGLYHISCCGGLGCCSHINGWLRTHSASARMLPRCKFAMWALRLALFNFPLPFVYVKGTVFLYVVYFISSYPWCTLNEMFHQQFGHFDNLIFYFHCNSNDGIFSCTLCKCYICKIKTTNEFFRKWLVIMKAFPCHVPNDVWIDICMLHKFISVLFSSLKRH